MSHMTDHQTGLQQLIGAADAPVTVRAVAQELGWSTETTRRRLEDLVERGLARRRTATAEGRGRPAMTYEAVAGMDRSGPTAHGLLARLLARTTAEAGDGPPDPYEVGRRWAQDQGTDRAATPRTSPSRTSPSRHSPLERASRAAEDLLAEHGFAPEREPADPTRITLRHCPFLDVAEEHPDVVCRLHDGMLAGVTAGTGVAHRLTPFARPDRCLVTLTPTGGDTP